MAGVWRYPRALERSDSQRKGERVRSNRRVGERRKSKEGDGERQSEGSPCDRLPSASLQSVWENGSPVCLCVHVSDVGPAVLLCLMWLPFLSGKASPPPPPPSRPPPVSLWSAIAQVPVPRRTRVSPESAFHALLPSSWHQLSSEKLCT